MQFARHIPFIHLLGAELLRFEDGESEIALDIRDELNNSWHVAHGGVVMTLLDVAMAHATRAPRKAEEGPDPRGVVTIEMKTTFMRPAQGRVTCIGKLLHRSAALAFCEGTVLECRRRTAGPCHRHLQVSFRAACGRPPHPFPRRFRLGHSMTTMNKQWHLVSRPSGEPTPDNFRLVELPVPELQDGQVLVRHHFMSLDPYMRGRMNDGKSYAQPQPLNAVMQGGTVGEVVASKSAAYQVGDKVVGGGGWQQYQLVDAQAQAMMRKVDTTHVPLSAYLGAVGMPGVTAWVGLMTIIEPKAGETVVVSAASGAVGAVVGQLAKAQGCRVVGLAGGPDKCRQ